MHAALHRSNMWHAFYLAMQHHMDCVHIYGKLADSGSRSPLCPSCVVCSHHACCLPDTKTVCVSSSPVLTAECWKMHVMCQVTLQSSLSLFKLSTSWRSRVRHYAVKYKLSAALKCPKKPPAKNPSLSVSMQPQKTTAHDNCTISGRNQVRIETVNAAFRGRHNAPLCSPSRHQKSDPHSSPRNSADLERVQD